MRTIFQDTSAFFDYVEGREENPFNMIWIGDDDDANLAFNEDDSDLFKALAEHLKIFGANAAGMYGVRYARRQRACEQSTKRGCLGRIEDQINENDERMMPWYRKLILKEEFHGQLEEFDILYGDDIEESTGAVVNGGESNMNHRGRRTIWNHWKRLWMMTLWKRMRAIWDHRSRSSNIQTR